MRTSSDLQSAASAVPRLAAAGCKIVQRTKKKYLKIILCNMFRDSYRTLEKCMRIGTNKGHFCLHTSPQFSMRWTHDRRAEDRPSFELGKNDNVHLPNFCCNFRAAVIKSAASAASPEKFASRKADLLLWRSSSSMNHDGSSQNNGEDGRWPESENLLSQWLAQPP